MKITFACFTLLALAACGDSKSTSQNYSFTENACPTGSHTFDSQQAYCDELRDESLNHGCARTLRAAAFKRDCSPAIEDTTKVVPHTESASSPVEPLYPHQGRAPLPGELRINGDTVGGQGVNSVQGQGVYKRSLDLSVRLRLPEGLSLDFTHTNPEVIAPEVRGCKLSSLDFSKTDEAGALQIHLLAVDETGTQANCLQFLTKVKRSGGVFRFFNVPSKTSAEDGNISLVNLTIQGLN